MILHDLMTPGFLTRDKVTGAAPKNSNNSNNSSSKEKTTIRKGDLFLYKNNETEKLAPAILAIPAIPNAAALPESCPLITGGAVPTACRFHPKLFAQLLAEGVLPAADGCPILKVCNMK